MPESPVSSNKATARVEAFSDGVFAIAITLLILEIRIPPPGVNGSNALLLAALGRLWPSFLSFGMSFFVILVMWVNHHELLAMARGVDSALLLANGLLLMMVTFVPFPTALIAQYLGSGGANVAAAAYCGTFILISMGYNLLFLAIVHKRRLLRKEVTDAEVRRVRIAYFAGTAVYAAATAASFLNAGAGLLICNALWILWTTLSYSAKARH